MATEMGEYVVGAYLRLIEECDVIDYNARPPGGGLEGLGELDVIGFNFKSQTVYLCEVATHLDGLLIGDNAATTVETIRRKYKRQQDYSNKFLTLFSTHRFMFWSPKVTNKTILEGLKTLEGLELVINGTYKA